MLSGAQHHHQIDGRGRGGARFVEPAARLGAGSVVARAGHNGASVENGSLSASLPFPFAGWPPTGLAKSDGRPFPLAGRRDLFEADGKVAVGHGAEHVGADLDVEATRRSADRAQPSSRKAVLERLLRPSLNFHGPRPQASRPACCDGGNMRRTNTTVDFQRTAKIEQVRA